MTADADRLDPAVWRLLGVVLLGPLMTHLDSTIVNVALPAIRQSLDAPFAEVQWVVSGYLLALALALPLNAWLVSRVGAKRLYLVCFSAFTLASLLCGLSRTMDELIAARMLQGICGGLLTPMTQMMIARAAGRRHMARVIGYVAVPVLVAPVAGPVVAGAIISHAGWPWLFFVNVPIGVVAVAAAAFVLPPDAGAEVQRPFDRIGFLLVCPGLVAVLYGLDHLAGANGAAALGSGLLLLALFTVHALRSDAALVDVRLFENRTFATATVTQFLSNGASMVGQMLLPLFLITGCGFSAATAGLMLAPMGIGMLFVYPSLGFLTERFGYRRVSAGGALLVTLSMLPVLWTAWNAVVPGLLIVALFFRGVGQSAIGAPSLSVAYGSVSREQIPVAGTALNIVQRLGGPTATTAIALVISATVPAGGGRSAFAAAVLGMIALQLLLFGSACRLPVRMR